MSVRIWFRPRITKKNMFFAQRVHWIVADFQKDRLIWDIKNIPKKPNSFQKIKNHFSSYVFFCL